MLRGPFELTSSIHRVAALLKATPNCNDWMHWSYENAVGEPQILDTLGQTIRAE